ncbi:DoxX family protein [Peijinzhouia sedimentorum]|tara:strand:- start:143 stop:505 length:363 start_codon:yes stop_codon:yes gene_type:complete
MKEESLSMIGRFLFALPIMIFGIFHFMNATEMSGIVPAYLPAPTVFVYISGAGLILASLSLILKIQTSLAMLLLGIMLLIFALTVHLPGAMDGAQASMSNLLKDIALSGAAFYFSGRFKS